MNPLFIRWTLAFLTAGPLAPVLGVAVAESHHRTIEVPGVYQVGTEDISRCMDELDVEYVGAVFSYDFEIEIPDPIYRGMQIKVGDSMYGGEFLINGVEAGLFVRSDSCPFEWTQEWASAYLASRALVPGTNTLEIRSRELPGQQWDTAFFTEIVLRFDAESDPIVPTARTTWSAVKGKF